MIFSPASAIVLSRIRYNDRYSIYHLYTLERGRVGVLVPESTHRRSPLRVHFQPLAELEVMLEDNKRKDLLHIKEVRPIDLHHQVHLDPVKSAQAMFLSEFLYRVCTLPEADPEVYHYISHSLELWGGLERGVANFHLCFLLHLLHVLGIAPQLPQEGEGRGLPFCLLDLVYTSTPRGASLSAEEALHLPAFLRMTYANMHYYRYSRVDRGVILDHLLDYYRLHLQAFPALRSLPILRQLVQEGLLRG